MKGHRLFQSQIDVCGSVPKETAATQSAMGSESDFYAPPNPHTLLATLSWNS